MKLPAVNCRVSSGIAPKPTRLRSMSYGAVASPSLSSRSPWRRLIIPVAPQAGSPLCSDKLQGILAKANKKRPNRSESNPQVHLLEIYPPAISLFYLTYHLPHGLNGIKEFCNCPADVFNGVAMKVYNHP